MTDQKQTFYFIGILIAGILIGYMLGNFVKARRASTPEIREVFSVSGVVKEIRGNMIIMEARIPSRPWEITMAMREAVVGEKTQIKEGIVKSPSELVSELQEYQKTGSINGQQTPQPFFITTKALTLDDIKPGNEIIVQSEGNIKTNSRIEATRIILQKMP